MKEDKIRLSHILESVDKILNWTSGVRKEEFMTNDQLQDAVIRRFEVIGEATKSISNTTREKIPRYTLEGNGRHERHADTRVF